MTAPRVRSEVGDLRAVLLHRPGPELKRLTPRNSDQLLFDAIPWVDRAQAEHDEFAEVLRGRGIEVLLLRELLTEALRDPEARLRSEQEAVQETDVATEVADTVRSHLSGLDEAALVHVLTAGMTFEELPASEGQSLVRRMHAPHDFAIGPLPNLLFTRDSSMWLGDRPAVTELAMPARRRETALTALVHAHHPRFAGLPRAFGGRPAPVEGGDVLVLAPGVFAVGVGERTSPAGAETFARSLFADGLAHTVLAVPIEQTRSSMHLDTVCTMVDRDAVLMYPAVRDWLHAFTLHPLEGGLSVTGPTPFLRAAAEAMGIERLRAVDTGLDPVTAEREQWEDGNNTLAVAPGVVIGYERNVETNERLREAGLDVLAVRGSELGSGRGGPRCMSCPISREPLPEHPQFD